ncbi:Linker for activation of T-cells family member 1 [Camelus dromedarius]|uniref:Linker for activation of T-cells family member 1 n=1 Tax=Camelus dromedarius TaxID=9838 RepID=A0A5N4CWV6_CAMDR|nr:Linker for activation of T-cells family member 1 [Camelus dromedarius]KAB1263332.1 Linker for activation of T-cells family member 1 [Camelus dromedarius]
MEAVSLSPYVLGLLLLPLLAVLLMALCVRCRELPGSYDTAASDSLTPSSIVIKRPREYMEGSLPREWGQGPLAWGPHALVQAPPVAAHLGPVSSATLAPWPPATSYPPVTSYPPLSQPDLLPIPRSPQPPGGSHRMPSSRQASDGANSVASYENEGVPGTLAALTGRRLGPVWGSTDPVSLPPEPVCEDEDEDEDEEDYHNEGYLVVLPDSVPATGTAVPPAPVSNNPGPRDSAFSMESGEDYVNVPESEESADASLATPGSREVEDEEAPDYENLQPN